ncbi:tyrosine-type recombinase/integrase [Streptomyces hygroscopicus]|uniref:tyrosine-type recombinase/integrase n=2 Tax=Streptomyces hygroscopicus TaxID=1912 RepID=UPI0009A02ADB|nr:tyrosine-type recombinase/integrase [Streptomyces hygroscopicus]
MATNSAPRMGPMPGMDSMISAGLVFCRLDGSPLRPQGVLVELRRRAAELGLPRIGVHDLRHTAATIMISSRVPLAVVSKTLRHSTLATTVNLYGHLLPHAAAIGTALERADRKHATANPGGQSEKRAA